MVKRVKKLLKGHEDLLDGFNCFLPDVSHSCICIYIYVFFFSSLFLDWNSLLFLGGGVLFLVVVLWAHVWESVSTERVTKIRLLLLQSFKCNRRINTGDTR